MRARIRIPQDTVDVFLNELSADDVQALLRVLDNDRNHPARETLYVALQRADVLLDKTAYQEF